MERETEQLLMRYLEGEMDEPSAQALEEQLKADAGLREEFVRFARQERVLRALLETDDEQFGRQILNQIRAERDGEAFVHRVQHEIGQKRRRTRRPLRPRKKPRSSAASLLAPLAAAAVLLAATATYLAFQKEATPPELVPALTEIRGAEAMLVRLNGAEAPAALGAELRPGQTLRLGTDTHARFQYPDGTYVDLSAGSHLFLEAPSDPPGKHLRLDQGTLTAHVTPQPARAPLIATTDLARATVRGTVFTLTAGTSATRLDVQRGRVELERLADSANVTVAEGQFAVAARDLAHALVASPSAPRDATVDDFLKRTCVHDKTRLPYRLFVPLQYDAARKYPLVLFLHGIGEKGIDNAKPLNNNANGAMVFVTGAVQARHPCFMLVPQSESGWWTAYQDVLPQLLTDLGGEYGIDMDRLYVTGLSSGGRGVWELLIHNPSLFAAGVPICGNGDPKKASLLVDVPIWNFHTADDPTMPVKGSRNMIEAIRKAGGKPYYTEYPTGGHGSSWVRAYKEPALVDWLMAQRRGRPASAPDNVPDAR